MKIKNIILFTCSALFINSTSAVESGITDHKNSPYVKFKSINIGDTTWIDGFWADKVKLAEEVMVPHMGSILKGDIGHAYNNFKIAAGLKEGDHQGWPWHDGDFYKWMEASMYIYTINQDEKIIKELDDIIKIIKQVQQESGYLSTYNLIKGIAPFTKRQDHELYNSGHLFTSAIMHHRITGQTNFFDIAVKHADYLYNLFQPKPARLARFGFNPSQIMGLVELYRETGNKKYLELAETFINMKGAVAVARPAEDPAVNHDHIGDMVQERTPLREETDAVGHAVLAMYLYAGAADVYAETGEQKLLDALERVWSSSNERRMYVTGAVGQTHQGVSSHGYGPKDMVHEGFIDDYVMPNSTAYNETCANISNAMFNWRMLSIKGEAKFADSMELVLYNSALSGISADGKHYYYTNPLRKVDGVWDYEKTVTEDEDRQAYLNCFCCPPNLVRTIAKLSGWAYSLTAKGVAVNLYGGNKLNTKLLDGSALKLTQATQYPWQGQVTITIDEAKKQAFEVLLRIPEWANNSKILINGNAIKADVVAGTFVTLERQWKQGDVISLDMPMDVNLIEGHARIEEVRNQVALKRGPVVYALETPDLPEDVDVLDVYIPTNTKFDVDYKADFLGGLAMLNGNVLMRKSQKNKMYDNIKDKKLSPVNLNFIPYYAWSNRGKANMTVFMPVVWAAEK